MSLARKTEEDRIDMLIAEVSQVTGETVARQLASIVESGEYEPFLPQKESLTAKVSRLSATKRGRERLKNAQTWADVARV